MSRANFISSIYNWRNYGFVNINNFQSCMSDLEMMELGLNFYVYEWNKTGVKEVEPKGLCSTACQHLLSKVEFPRKEFPKPSTITQSYNFKKASAFKASALSWVPQGTHVKPHVRAPNSLDHHPLLRFQVYQLAGASDHRHLELHSHLSSCSRETGLEEVSSKKPKLKERSSKYFSPDSLGNQSKFLISQSHPRLPS